VMKLGRSPQEEPSARTTFLGLIRNPENPCTFFLGLCRLVKMGRPLAHPREFADARG
jgi:hypothetical protein